MIFAVGSWPLIYDALRLIDKRINKMPAFIKKAKMLADSIRHIPYKSTLSYPTQTCFTYYLTLLLTKQHLQETK